MTNISSKKIETDEVVMRINQRLDDLKELYKQEQSDEKSWDEIEEDCEVARAELYDLIGELRNSDVIQTLMRATREDITPQPALDYWVSSWC